MKRRWNCALEKVEMTRFGHYVAATKLLSWHIKNEPDNIILGDLTMTNGSRHIHILRAGLKGVTVFEYTPTRTYFTRNSTFYSISEWHCKYEFLVNEEKMVLLKLIYG